MGQLKSHMRNTKWVEGSIAEGHLAAESMFYCANIVSTIDPHAPQGWVLEDDAKEERCWRLDKLIP